MPRDFARNLYVTVGFPRDSQTYQALLAEMAETGLALSQVIAVRLADYYRMERVPPPAVPQLAGHEEDARRNEAETAQEHEQQALASRAREAAAAWAFDDE
jgi:hypothetical protein